MSVTHLLKAAEVADILGTTTDSLSTQRAARRGPRYVKLGSAVRYPADDLSAYIAARVVETVDSLAA